MYIPNIPSVSTSVLDQSTTDVVINSGRVVLIPGFFRYGKEGFTTLFTDKQLKFSMGASDIKKYGNAYLYAEGALKAGASVIAARLLPDDATYANNCILSNGSYQSYPNIFSKNDLYAANNEITISGLASNRGEGYNNIFVTFSPAIANEKMDSNAVGETNYKFNFVQADIYEETSTGIKSLGDPIVFSLIDVDPITNERIIDKNNGNALFVNSVFKNANDFATLMVNEDMLGDLSVNTNIDALTENRLIVEDSDTIGKYYEVKVETYTKVVVDAYGVNTRIQDTRLSAVITTTAPKVVPILTYTDANGGTSGKQIVIRNSVISFEDVAPSTGAQPYFYLDGQEAFYKLEVDNATAVTYSEVSFLRHTIYRKLMDYSMKLYSGTDGKYLSISGKLNMYGTSESGKQNARELLLNFYNNTEILREVLYPVYDFDYMPDWSQDAEVQVAITRLADDIGISMPILSLPLSYDPKVTTRGLVQKDLDTRNQTLFVSSYNSAMYTGQMNKTHKTDDNLRMYMPMSYYAMLAHIRIDNQYSITEPVANMIKGTLDSTEINLTYAPSSLEIESLRNAQINAVISEPDGTYFIDQLTMYKKASKLSRINVVKVLHRIRKDLPRKLKDLIQNKANIDIIETAVTRTNSVLAKWVVSEDNKVDGIFEYANVTASYNDQTYKLRLTITVKPIGTLESIDIPIIVV